MWIFVFFPGGSEYQQVSAHAGKGDLVTLRTGSEQKESLHPLQRVSAHMVRGFFMNLYWFMLYFIAVVLVEVKQQQHSFSNVIHFQGPDVNELQSDFYWIEFIPHSYHT